MNIGDAMKALIKGRVVYRSAWKDAVIDLIRYPTLTIVMRIPGGYMFPWNITQEDVLANDWKVLN